MKPDVDMPAGGPRSRLILPGLIAAAFLIRVAVTVTAYYPTIDSGTVGLMACHILEGERPLYFYGQQYMGALEAYVAALFVSWMGPSVLAVGLSPILFSLCWLIAVWGLVREIYGTRTALAAATIIAVPPWHVLWYSIGTYGGYPATWFLATCGLWLVVRQWKNAPDSPGTCLRFAGLGLCSGLGIWTNPQSVMVLAVAWVAAAVYVLKSRSSVRHLAIPVILCALAALVSAAPAIVTAIRGTDSSMLTAWNFDGTVLVNRVKTFLLPGLKALVWSREEMHPAWWFLTAICVLSGTVLLTASILRSPTRGDRVKRLAPAAVIISCILFALPHDMADERAPRYLILLWSSLAVWIFAVPVSLDAGFLRSASYLLLGSWIGLQSVAILIIAKDKHPNRVQIIASRDLIADASRSLGHPPVYLVGGEIFGHRSQPWNFHAGGRAKFVSSFDERAGNTSEEAESSPDYALACEPHLGKKLSATLRDLNVKYSETETDAVRIFHGLKVPMHPSQNVQPESVHLGAAVKGESVRDKLFDRDWCTGVSEEYGEASFIDVDLGSVKNLDAMTMYSPHWFHDDLPTSFQIEHSNDGIHFTLFKDVTNRFSSAYRSAGRVYIKGYQGCMETSLRGLSTRFLRIRPRSGASAFPRWSINELYLFEALAPGDRDVEIPGMKELERAMRDRNLHFIYSDRAQSARIRRAFRQEPGNPAFPRYNPKFPHSLISRQVIPSQGKAILVEHRYAEECVRLLEQTYRGKIVTAQVDLGWYELLVLKSGERSNDPCALFWNGHTLVKVPGSPPRWH